jgi:excisionase family DNA binding protein
MEKNEHLLTPDEAAKRLRIGKTQLYAYLATGALTSLKLGRCRRIPATAVDQFIATVLEEQKAGVAV